MPVRTVSGRFLRARALPILGILIPILGIRNRGSAGLLAIAAGGVGLVAALDAGRHLEDDDEVVDRLGERVAARALAVVDHAAQRDGVGDAAALEAVDDGGVVAVAVAGEEDEVAAGVGGEPARAGVGHGLVPDDLDAVDAVGARHLGGGVVVAVLRRGGLVAGGPGVAGLRVARGGLAPRVGGAAAHVLHERVEPGAVRGVVELELGDLGLLVGGERFEAVVGDLLGQLARGVGGDELGAGADRGVDRGAGEAAGV